jgi:hypothetical protein
MRLMGQRVYTTRRGWRQWTGGGGGTLLAVADTFWHKVTEALLDLEALAEGGMVAAALGADGSGVGRAAGGRAEVGLCCYSMGGAGMTREAAGAT